MPNIKTLPRTVESFATIAAADLETGAVGAAALAAGSIVSAAMNETLVKIATVALTNANVLALRATPITIVSAPGAGKVLELISITLYFDYTAAYTETADNLAVRYTDGSGVIVSQAIETTGFLDATADTMTNGLPKIDAIAAKTGCENKALVLHNTGDGEFGGGNAANVINVRTVYRVNPTLW